MKTTTVKTRGFDFLDFGASKAESLQFGITRLGGKKGLGVDLDPERVAKMNKQGLDCIVGDITNLNVEENAVRFVKMVHILEHLPSVKDAEKTIATAKRVAKDFIVINGPFFDEDAYLKKNKLKLEWADYPEHTLAFKVSDLVKILDRLKFKDYEVYLRYKIKDSSHPAVLPLKAPPGTHGYESVKHIKKAKIIFDRDIWAEFVCYVPLRPIKNWEAVTAAYTDKVPYVIKTKGYTETVPQTAIDQFVDLHDKLNAYRRNTSKLKNTLVSREKTIASFKRRLDAIENSFVVRFNKRARHLITKK